MTTLVSGKTNNFAGKTAVPGDKSISIRALILAALAEGRSKLLGLPASEDVETTIRVLKTLGVGISRKNNETVVDGVGERGFRKPSEALDFGNSGTASRLMMGVLAGQDFEVEITGDPSLRARPFLRVIEPLSRMGANFEGQTLPLKLTGSKNLKPIEYSTPVASAQVKSTLLFAGLGAKGKTVVFEKTPTRNHTERMFEALGLGLESRKSDSGRLVSIQGPGVPRAFSFQIPGDISGATFLMGAALVARSPGVVIERVGVNPTRAGILKILEKMGARITLSNRKNDSGEEMADIHIKSGRLKGVITEPGEASALIDEFPMLFVLAAFAETPSRFQGLAELRHKESDRLELMAQGLKANGVRTELLKETLAVFPGPVKGGSKINARRDHRIAMAFLVLGTGAANPVSVSGAETISTSFPGFAKIMNALGAKIEGDL